MINFTAGLLILLVFNFAESTTCGQKGRTSVLLPKIVGGHAADKGEYPWQISIHAVTWSGPVHFCGGSIIDERTVITAAQCVDGLNTWNIRVLAGVLRFSKREGTEQSADVSEIIIHQRYDSKTMAHDIALLKLSTPLIFNEFVAPICLPTAFQEHTGATCIITGWGDVVEGVEQGSDILIEASVSIVSDIVCRQSYGTQITDNLVCSGYAAGGTDSCRGDAGGPLVCKESNGQYSLTGIISRGIGCGRPTFYGINVQVSHYIAWINLNKV